MDAFCFFLFSSSAVKYYIYSAVDLLVEGIKYLLEYRIDAYGEEREKCAHIRYSA
jgi:hypothetical protein